MLRHMLVLLEDSPETEFVTGQALVMARGYGGVISGLVPCSGTSARERASADSFASAVSAAGFPARSAVEGDPERALSHGEPVADLIFMPRGEYRDAPIGSAVEPWMRRLSLPCVVTSRVAPEIRRIAVAYDGSPAAFRALAAAADLATSWKPRPPEILLVAIVLPGEPCHRPLHAARTYLERYGLAYRPLVREGTPWVELPEIFERQSVDLVCMGAYGHAAWREQLMGSTTRMLLEQRRGPTLLCH